MQASATSTPPDQCPPARCAQPPALCRTAGFTLIELMIVVVIIGVLAVVAAVAYTRHIKKGRILDAQEMLGQIKVQQEVYYQHHNQYVSAPVYPPLQTEFAARPWQPTDDAWAQLGVQAPRNLTYFSFWTVAFAPPDAGDAISTALGLDTRTPFFYAVAQADVDSNAATGPMQIVVGSGASRRLVRNENQ